MESVPEKVRHPRGHLRSVQEEPSRLEARQAQHLQEQHSSLLPVAVGQLFLLIWLFKYHCKDSKVRWTELLKI